MAVSFILAEYRSRAKQYKVECSKSKRSAVDRRPSNTSSILLDASASLLTPRAILLVQSDLVERVRYLGMGYELEHVYKNDETQDLVLVSHAIFERQSSRRKKYLCIDLHLLLPETQHVPAQSGLVCYLWLVPSPREGEGGLSNH